MPNNDEFYIKYKKYKDKYLEQSKLLKQKGGTQIGDYNTDAIYNLLNQSFKYFFIKESVLTALLAKGIQVGVSKTDKNYYTFPMQLFFEILNLNSYYLNIQTHSLILVNAKIFGTMNQLSDPTLEDQFKQNIVKQNLEIKLSNNLKTSPQNEKDKKSFFEIASFSNPATHTSIDGLIQSNKEALQTLYPVEDICEYMTKQITGIMSSFENELDFILTKAMLSIDSIVENKDLCLQQTINLDLEERFTTIDNVEALSKIQLKVDKAFYESWKVMYDPKLDEKSQIPLETSRCIIQILVDSPNNTIILLTYKDLPNDESQDQYNDQYYNQQQENAQQNEVPPVADVRKTS
jgi:hypothetical protein